MTSRNPTISKIARRLRKAQEITYQTTVENIADDKIIKRYPQIVNEAIDSIIVHLNVIKDQAKLVETSRGRKEERNEIMIGITQELASLSTIMGGSAENLKTLAHSDHNYIRGVILLSAEEAWIKAVKDMNESERLQFENRLNQVGYSVEMGEDE